ncbi:IS30 family transposase [Paraliobacillus sp. JSM ZJ581]|uniref:IS30 family transposase n=1 Tax=Paraliobacillus sp. JSM ZJ581 TaxID=3342118 RepID=UPI0035A823E2
MTQNHSNTKERKFTHLTEIEKGQIEAYLDEDLSLREIARRMGRDVSTISRERDRGTVEQIDTNRRPYKKYFLDVGTRVYKENRKNCGNHSNVMKAWNFNAFAEKVILEEHWSPDAVVGYANRHKKFEYIPSTKTLYNWIDEGKLSVINMDLALKLRRSTKSTKSRKHKKVLGRSIEERPESVETRKEFGHWEIDTVEGRKSNDDALLTLIERKTRHKIIRRIPSNTAPAVTNALQEIFAEYEEVQDVFKTITADNGSEFSALSEQGEGIQMDVYFCHPYASWERGSNERHNGLIRKFIKKGQPIHSYSDEKIADVENWMNTLPRKILNYQTPGEAFAKFVDCVA